ncbi:MAG: glycoside hydrolase family 20 zincin-like fold domain-containing protein [Kiritimatiellae bacterium]|nr:glycoside hydrolase family 20 zincin-like fold domain-containing protein [Kiritimatiellia bacterium]
MNPELLPPPARMKTGEGRLMLQSPVLLHCSPKTRARLQHAIEPVRDALDRRGLAMKIAEAPAPPAADAPGIVLLTPPGRGGEGFRLTASLRRITVAGDGWAGLFYGLQTLRQILAAGNSIPSMEIEDAPSLPQRGFYLDISRGRVPKLEALKRLADRLSFLKYNQLQLYVEHVFDFQFNPAIAQHCDPLTAEDIAALDEYCRERFIELVPSLTCFGHMGRILSLPEYRRLAEIEFPAASWEAAAWLTRLRGATLNPRLAGSRALIGRMLDEFLPLFSSDRFNMCGDETYDLGKGANAGTPVDELYTEHLAFVRKLAAQHNKRLMCWGDVLLKQPRAVDRIPKDITILDWGYEPETDFLKAQLFRDAGLAVYVCPSTKSFKVLFNEIEKARSNIAGYAQAAKHLGAEGMLVTDWGDMGHFNMPACSLHGMALGGTLAWNNEADSGEGFDRAFDAQVFGAPACRAAELFSRAGRAAQNSWPGFLQGSMNAENAEELDDLADRAGTLRPGGMVTRQDLDEIRLALQALRLRVRRTPEQVRDFADDYERIWLETSRPAGLCELLQQIRGLP